MTHRARRIAALRSRFASVHGAVDLASILVGVVIVAVIAGVLTAGAAVAIPWAQDQSARQALNNLRIAEASANVKTGAYLNETDLIAGKFIDSKTAIADVPADGSCYIGAVRSHSGTILWIASGDNNVSTYKVGDTSTCSDLKKLTDRVQGIDPDAGNTLNLSYSKQTFDPTGSNEVLSPTVSGGDTYTYTADKDLSAYGINFDGTTGKFTGPATWSKSFEQVSTSYSHTCGVGNGALWCWGNNGNQQVGPSALGATVGAPTPVVFKDAGGNPIAVNVTAVSAGYVHTCAIADGAAWCWGYGNDGELGGGAYAGAATPVKVGGVLAGKTVTTISAGYFNTCAIADGAAYCWGGNASGQLGTGNTTATNLPTAVTGLPVGTVTAISSSASNTASQAFACAIVAGAPYCWGYGLNGELGNGAGASSTTPVPVTTSGVLSGKNITKLETGTGHSCVIASSDAYCWGNGTNGQLGNGGTTTANAPVAVTGLPAGKVTAISAGRIQTCAIANGLPYCWGDNSYGNFGNGSSASNVPVPNPTQATVTSPGLQGVTLTDVTAGDRHTCWTGGSATYCTGDNSAYSQLGDGTSTSVKTPKLVPGTGANAAIPSVNVTISSKGYTRTTAVAIRLATK